MRIKLFLAGMVVTAGMVAGAGTPAAVADCPPGTSDPNYCQTPGKPKAETRPADEIKCHKVRLNGEVNPNGLSTQWWFEYGTTKSYGHQTTHQTLPFTDFTNHPVKVPGLQVQPNTTYHFRLVAQNSLGTKTGRDLTFTTPSCGSSRKATVKSKHRRGHKARKRKH